jgi:hypothetical protein
VLVDRELRRLTAEIIDEALVCARSSRTGV